jgi:hypothetical protein
MLSARLQAGETGTYKEHGGSMLPKLKSGVTVVVAPCKLEDLKVGDIAFCKVGRAHYLHYVKAIGQDGRVQIGNAHGHINGWTRRVYGKLVDFTNP